VPDSEPDVAFEPVLAPDSFSEPDLAPELPDSVSVPVSSLSPVPADSSSVLCCDWDLFYSKDSIWQGWWRAVHDPKVPWPEGVQLREGKLLWNARECIPTPLVGKILWELHCALGHPGAKRLWSVACLRYHWPVLSEARKLSDGVSRQCHTCQACSDPNFRVAGPIVPTPIPERLGESMSLDVVYLPVAVQDGVSYDCIVVAVDRGAGLSSFFHWTG